MSSVMPLALLTVTILTRHRPAASFAALVCGTFSEAEHGAATKVRVLRVLTDGRNMCGDGLTL